MIGVYDFCGHYEWTFGWLGRQGGEELVAAYWDQAIYRDSQTHARELIAGQGFAGMREYWGHTLTEEGASWVITSQETVFRIDMHECPSKGFLLRNRLEQYSDYCNHCIGWVGQLLDEAGFKVDHEHNHRGQCWWEIRKATDPSPPSPPGGLLHEGDARHLPDWDNGETPVDSFLTADRTAVPDIEAAHDGNA